jgi:hypothetical protein
VVQKWSRPKFRVSGNAAHYNLDRVKAPTTILNMNAALKNNEYYAFEMGQRLVNRSAEITKSSQIRQSVTYSLVSEARRTSQQNTKREVILGNQLNMSEWKHSINFHNPICIEISFVHFRISRLTVFAFRRHYLMATVKNMSTIPQSAL